MIIFSYSVCQSDQIALIIMECKRSHTESCLFIYIPIHFQFIIFKTTMQNKFGPVWGPNISGKGYFENCTSFGLDQTEHGHLIIF